MANLSPRKTVLLVDDSQTHLMMEQMVLGSLQCEIVLARDGAEAVDRVLECRPNLILMDVEMPRMNGYDACRRIRFIMGSQVPILLLTTRGSTEHLRRGFECGCTCYMTKPIGSQELLLKVRTYLGR